MCWPIKVVIIAMCWPISAEILTVCWPIRAENLTMYWPIRVEIITVLLSSKVVNSPALPGFGARGTQRKTNVSVALAPRPTAPLLFYSNKQKERVPSVLALIITPLRGGAQFHAPSDLGSRGMGAQGAWGLG